MKEDLRRIDPEGRGSARFQERKVAIPKGLGGRFRIDEATPDDHMGGIVSHTGGGDGQPEGLGLSIENGEGERVAALGKAAQRKDAVPGNLLLAIEGMVSKPWLKMLEILGNTGQCGVGLMTTPDSSAAA